MPTEPYNSADEDAVKDAAQERKNDRDQELEDMKDILSKAAGVRFFQRMFDDSMIFRTTFTGNSQTFHNEGQRVFALKFLNDVREVAPQLIPRLMLRDIKK